jgi:ABC-type glycerol-3-phosphate transport system permease component
MIAALKRGKRLGEDALLYGLLTATALFMLLPFIWMLSTSFKAQAEIFIRPPVLISPNMSLDGYRYIVDLGVLRALRNTFVVSASFTALSLFFCALGGYGFAKFRFPGRNFLFAFLLGTMIIPGAVTMVPTYIMMLRFGWIDSYLPLIIPGAANAFGIFFMRQYISAISDELLDAARIDGAGEFGIITLGLIFFLGAWNNYLGPLIYLKSPSKFTLPLFMMQMSGPPGYSAYREWMGVAVISVVPLLVIFLALQRRFIEGITAGATKG